MTQADTMRRATELMRDEAGKWKYVRQNLKAIDELEKKIAESGFNCTTMTYSELMIGLMVDKSPIGSGDWAKFPEPPWSGHNEIYGEVMAEFLRAISMSSASQYGFMASVLVVYAVGRRNGGLPGDEFYNLARELNLFTSRYDQQQLPQGQVSNPQPGNKPISRKLFFEHQKDEACRFYKQNPNARPITDALTALGL